MFVCIAYITFFYIVNKRVKSQINISQNSSYCANNTLFIEYGLLLDWIIIMNIPEIDRDHSAYICDGVSPRGLKMEKVRCADCHYKRSLMSWFMYRIVFLFSNSFDCFQSSQRHNFKTRDSLCKYTCLKTTKVLTANYYNGTNLGLQTHISQLLAFGDI